VELAIHRDLAEVIESFARGVEESTVPEDRARVGEILTALAPLLATVTRGSDIVCELPRMDRLFESVRLLEDEPFREALSKWAAFREEYPRFALSGMTVNERLYVLGTAEAYDRAKEARDAGEMERILKEAQVDMPSIRLSIRNMRRNMRRKPRR
jgi:hypothetical protein